MCLKKYTQTNTPSRLYSRKKHCVIRMLCTCCLCDAHRFVKSVYIYTFARSNSPFDRCPKNRHPWDSVCGAASTLEPEHRNKLWMGGGGGDGQTTRLRYPWPFCRHTWWQALFLSLSLILHKIQLCAYTQESMGLSDMVVLSKSVKLIFKLQLMGVRRRRVTNNSRKSLCGCVRKRGCGVRR